MNDISLSFNLNFFYAYGCLLG
ncbi:hypothetical protein FJY90_03320 [Candidatus Gottesmanbacteria bacterium]|nr:hypothetical protein [Candidatus Gottesmanbacteria bacterium]